MFPNRSSNRRCVFVSFFFRFIRFCLCVCVTLAGTCYHISAVTQPALIYIYIRSLPQLPSGNVERIEKHASVAYSYERKWKVKKKISTHILKPPFGVSSIHTLYKLNECPYPWSSDSWHEYHLFLFGIYGMLLFFFKKF